MSEITKTMYGKAKFCYLTTPDDAFGIGVYKVTLEVPKAEAQVHVKALQEIVSKEVAEEHKARPGQTALLKRANPPFKDEGDVVTFKFHSKFKPKLWDKNQKELGADVAVWKDSTMRIKYELSSYDQTIGVGCSLYLLSVQVVNLVKGSSQNGKCSFPKVESALPGPEEKALY